MKILMIFPAYQPGYQKDGIGDYTRILVEELRDKGNDVRVIASGRYSGIDADVVKVGNGKWGRNELAATMKEIEGSGYDVVHMQYSPVSYGFGVTFKLLPLLVRLKARRTLFVITFHTLVGGRWVSRMNALLLTMFSHKVISTNEELTGLFGKWFAPFLGKLTQIPIGSNIPPAEISREDARAEFEKENDISRDCTLLANFGFPNPWKGVEDIFEALRLVTNKGKYRLAMICSEIEENKEYLRSLKGQAAEKGIENSIIWIEGEDGLKVSRSLKAADIFIAPYHDGISIRRGTLMAAIVNGLPVVSTYPRVDMPYFEDNKNVILVPASDPEALAAAVERVAMDIGLRTRLSDNITLLAQRFDWGEIADRTLKVYNGQGETG
ncbi:MAG: glycosyltransferase [Candidatus Tantalella remota]|nr:glycosyltransferase [Candidatus Tantalella remota]